MGVLSLLVFAILVLACAAQSTNSNVHTILSSVLTPDTLKREGRSYYDRYEEKPRCGRCDDDDDDDDRDRDDDRRSNRPTYGNRNDRNKNYDDDNRNFDDRKNTNGTEGEDDKKRHDDRDKPSKRNKNRHRYDDRDRYRPDYYDRFLRDPYRSSYDRPYEDPYMRRPSYDRYPYQDRYDDGYGRYDDPSYSGYRRPYTDDRYDRGGYDRYGGYGPGVGRGTHDSFRPWDETYRGQAGWDDGGRGYYFASGRPDSTNWAQRDYARPVTSGWQSSGYNANRDQGYQGRYGDVQGYQDAGYGSSAYGQVGGQSSGWRNVGYSSRPYRDQSGVTQLDNRRPPDVRYGQNGHASYGQQAYQQTTSTTQGTSYLFQREDENVTKVDTTDSPSS